MKSDWTISVLRSRAFGAACWIALAVFLTAFLYAKFVRPRANREVNISCFAYRDINRNGVYDLEDRPYAGLKITMSRPKGDPVIATSNIAGFANFVMSEGNRKADVKVAGAHTITIEPPDRWKITSGNGVQTVNFEKLPGSPAGIVAERTYQTVGVAPELAISGSVKIAESDRRSPMGKLRVRGSKGESMEVPLSRDGAYSFPADAGEWTLDYVAASGATTSRVVAVKSYPVRVAEIDPSASAPGAKPVIRRVGFDTLTPSDTLYEVPHGYEGLKWTNWVATHQKLYQVDGFINAATSGEYVAYNSSGHPAFIASDQPFDLAGAYITGAWPESENFDVMVRAWRNTTVAYEDRFRVTTAGPVFLDADYRSVTKIEFLSAANWQVIVDDLEFRLDQN